MKKFFAPSSRNYWTAPNPENKSKGTLWMRSTRFSNVFQIEIPQNGQVHNGAPTLPGKQIKREPFG